MTIIGTLSESLSKIHYTLKEITDDINYRT